ncbi:MAG: peptidoglycan editing factor PgeF [Pseudomonadota bacterium]
MLALITPDWPAPPWIKAATTTRRGGFSDPPFDSLNLSLTVGDNPDSVIQNQKLLKSSLGLPKNPLWLKQVHGNKAVSANSALIDLVADATYSQESHVVCAVQTADCLPLLVCSRTRYCIAAIHAGWKGLASGIIENSIKSLDCSADDLLVWLGPAIGPQAFVVGAEVVKAFIEKDHEAKAAFRQIGNNHWQANLYQLAKRRLAILGVKAIYGGNYCTYTDKDQFFSFRRDKVTGRMASLIWISPSSCI